MNAASRIFRLLVGVFPRRHRARFGEEMARAFDEGCARARSRRGRLGGALWVLRAWADVLRSGLAERLRARRAVGAARTRRWWGGLRHDARYAVRVLARSPLFTASAVVVLALGIGANTAVFGALRAAIFAPSPYPEPERLAFARITVTREGQPEAGAGASSSATDGISSMTWSWAKFRMLRDGLADLADVAGYAHRRLILAAPGEPEPVGVEIVTPAYLRVLGVPLLMGRDFEPADETPGGEPVVMITHALWVSRFAADPDVLGRTLELNETTFTIVGVLPDGFAGLTGQARAVLPMGAVGELYQPWMLEEPQAHWIHAILRAGRPGASPLRPGPSTSVGSPSSAGSAASASAPPSVPAAMAILSEAVTRLGREIEAVYPLADPGETVGARLHPLEDVRTNRGARASAVALGAAAVLVLLISVANLAALLLARAGARTREAAVRLAVGAGRWRLARGFLVESLVLAVMGGVAGVGVGIWATGALRAAWPSEFLSSEHGEIRAVDLDALTIDGQALAFAACVTLLAGLLFGVVPAVRAHTSALVSMLRTGGALAGADGATATGGRRLLVGVQSALALVLAVGAALLASTLVELQSVERGFDPEGLLVFRYDARRGDVAAADPGGFQDALLQRLRALPGVQAAGAGSIAPLSGHAMMTIVREAEGSTPYPQGQGPRIGIHVVDGGYFETLGASLRAGRMLEPGDADGPRVVINETAARLLFPEADPVGRSMETGYHVSDAHDGRVEIVGVVADILHNRPNEDRLPEAYYPVAPEGLDAGTILVRTEGDPMEMFPLVRDLVGGMDPELPLTGITTGRDLVMDAVADTRVVLALLGIFAGLALVLAATGVYAVVAYAVLDRRRELGVRIALGARRGQVVAMVLRQGMLASGAGIIAGLLVALAVARYLESLLFQVSPTSPSAYAAAATVLLAAALLASWLPARRVTRLDPTEALRGD